MSHERRRFVRVEFDATTELSQGQQCWSTRLHDLSLKGLLLARPELWNGHPEQPFTVRITLNDGTPLQLEAKLTRNAEDYLGFECLHIDLDSISHLRRLVELNLGDMALLERELATLIEQA